MAKRYKIANENIKILVEELVDARREALGSGNCPYYGRLRPCEENGDDCYRCKERYFGNMREELLEEYLVK